MIPPKNGSDVVGRPYGEKTTTLEAQRDREVTVKETRWVLIRQLGLRSALRPSHAGTRSAPRSQRFAGPVVVPAYGIRLGGDRIGPFATTIGRPRVPAAKAYASPFDVQAYRGGRAALPENTLAAFRHAQANPGVSTIDLATAVSRDGVLAINHDRTVDGALPRHRPRQPRRPAVPVRRQADPRPHPRRAQDARLRQPGHAARAGGGPGGADGHPRRAARAGQGQRPG